MKILIVGGGNMGHRHKSMAKKLLPDSEIKVLSAYNSKKQTYNVEFITNLHDALQFNPDIAVIANPATYHIEFALKLVEKGVDLLIEKPLSHSLENVSRLLKLSRENNVIIMMGYNLRFSKSLQEFRNLLNKKIIGKVLSIRSEVGQYLPNWRPNIDYKESVSANSRLGGGVVLELSHEIDYLRWIFGEITWVRSTLSRQSFLEIDVEDTAHLVVGFSPDQSGHQIIGNINIDFIRHDHVRMCTVIGESGTLRWNGINNTVEIFKSDENHWKEIFAHKPELEEDLEAEWIQFLQAAKSKTIPTISGEDGLRVLEVIEASRVSSETGKQILVTASLAT